MDQFQRPFSGPFQRLRRLAPAAIQDRVSSRDTRRSGGILAAHDADQHIDRGTRMAARQRTDFSESSGHDVSIPSWPGIAVRRKASLPLAYARPSRSFFLFKARSWMPDGVRA